KTPIASGPDSGLCNGGACGLSLTAVDPPPPPQAARHSKEPPSAAPSRRRASASRNVPGWRSAGNADALCPPTTEVVAGDRLGRANRENDASEYCTTASSLCPAVAERAGRCRRRQNAGGRL